MPSFHSRHGVFKVINRQKFLGNRDPEFKSGMELKAFRWMDLNANVLRWGYEVVKVPYLFTIDNRIHTYITDIYCEILSVKKQVVKYILEIKPLKETALPIMPKANNQRAMLRYKNEMITYIKNSDKWRAAKQFCEARGILFVPVTEEDLKKLCV